MRKTTEQYLAEYRPLPDSIIFRKHAIDDMRFNDLEVWERHQADLLSDRLSALDIIMAERGL